MIEYSEYHEETLRMMGKDDDEVYVDIITNARDSDDSLGLRGRIVCEDDEALELEDVTLHGHDTTGYESYSKFKISKSHVIAMGLRK